MESWAARAVVAWGASSDAALLRRLVAREIAADAQHLAERRLCPTCGGSDHGRPSVTLGTAPVGWVSLARHEATTIVAWSPDAPVGVDLDSTDAGEAWVRREARGKADGSGITGDDPVHVTTRLLEAPEGLLAALAIDTPQPWSVRVTSVPGAPSRRATPRRTRRRRDP